MEQENKVQLIVTLDLGASASKGAYTIYSENDRTSNQIEFMTMGSEIAKVPTSILQSAIEINSQAEDVAWIKSKSKDNEGIAIGTFAKKYACKEEQIENVKYEFAVDKCLAFVGAIAYKHGVTELPDIMFNLLIPSDEKESAEVLRKNIAAKIKSYYFKDTLVRGKITSCHINIEGTGGILNRIGNRASKGKIVALMLGHRNCSCLVLDRGNLSHSCIRLGYFDYLKSIRENAIGQKFEDLEYVIPRIEKEPEPKIRDKWLNSLIKGTRSSNQKEEKKKLETAIANSRKLHWTKIANWLDTQIPDRLDEILILGGASGSFRKELSEYLWADLSWCEDVIEELKTIGKLNEEDLSRYVDVFGLHKQYSNIEFSQEVVCGK